MGQDFYQTYAHTRVECRFSCPLCPKHRKTSRECPEMAPSFPCRSQAARNSGDIFPSNKNPFENPLLRTVLRILVLSYNPLQACTLCLKLSMDAHFAPPPPSPRKLNTELGRHKSTTDLAASHFLCWMLSKTFVWTKHTASAQVSFCFWRRDSQRLPS